jgi:hypothetical protein
MVPHLLKSVLVVEAVLIVLTTFCFLRPQALLRLKTNHLNKFFRWSGIFLLILTFCWSIIFGIVLGMNDLTIRI